MAFKVPGKGNRHSAHEKAIFDNEKKPGYEERKAKARTKALGNREIRMEDYKRMGFGDYVRKDFGKHRVSKRK